MTTKSKSMKSKRLSPLQELLAMQLTQRLDAIVEDLLTHKDKFRKIDAHDLAQALGVPENTQPGKGWQFTTAVLEIDIEEYASMNYPASELVYLIQEDVSVERFDELLQLSAHLDEARELNFHFLTPAERELLRDAIGAEELRGALECIMGCIAHYSVQTKSGYSLEFEGEIEDDGACINLKTPYDYRDGKFSDLSDCVTESW